MFQDIGQRFGTAWIVQPLGMILEQVLQTTHSRCDHRPVAGHEFPSFLREAVFTEGVVGVTNNGYIQAIVEYRHLFEG